MCGIICGISSENNVISDILQGLTFLEYRGYDSAGIAGIINNKLVVEKTTDRLQSLRHNVDKLNLSCNIGIGHTRWATHGKVSITNCHPIISNNTIALVHNGIINNHQSIKDDLLNMGYVFTTETDSEVIAHLIHSYYIIYKDLLKAVTHATKKLQGQYSLAVISKNNPNRIVCTKLDTPLIVGISNNNSHFIASDTLAFSKDIKKVVYLEDGDTAVLEANQYHIYNDKQLLVTRTEFDHTECGSHNMDLKGYAHYMRKEIFEQPDAVQNTLSKLPSDFNCDFLGENAHSILKSINKVQLIACGTSYFAALLAKYWLESIAKMPANIDIASEYTSRDPAFDESTLFIVISQSGETSDTISSVKYLKNLGVTNILSVCNVKTSTLTRLSTLNLITHAGPEIGVASTKAFTTQLVSLFYITYSILVAKQQLSKVQASKVWSDLLTLPEVLSTNLALEDQVKEISLKILKNKSMLFIGRNILYPVALEGALKLKELSYIHAEGYAGGELKHGPLALINKDMTTIALINSHILAEKTKANIEEILARNGMIYIISDTSISIKNNGLIELDLTNLKNSYLAPIVYNLPLQLLAYHSSLALGNDVDKPRNLAKSVTVE